MSTEYMKLSRDQLTDVVKGIAKMNIIGSFFVGEIGQPEVRWLDDGGVEVITEYKRQELPPIIPEPRKKRK